MTSFPGQESRIRRYLERAPAPVFATYAVFAAFSTYFCMYAFRKPFAAATFAGDTFFGTPIGLKTALVVSQIIGYALSKYIGIKVCSEVSPGRRARLLVSLVLWAELALIAFGALPMNWKVLAMFLNGLPLGMVWGLVVWYLEGRRASEVLLAGLSLSFIVSSGIVKDLGRALLEGTAATAWMRVPWIGEAVGPSLGHVSDAWMPAITGLHFLPLFLLSVWLLSQLPPPNALDVTARSARKPMTFADRAAFVRRFLPGLILLCAAYFFLTAYRDIRDNYQVELFDALGYSYHGNETIISRAETLTALGVMLAISLLNIVRDNRRGLLACLGMMTVGMLLLGIATMCWQSHLINGFWWITLTGIGSYLAYLPYNAVLFERLIASTRVTGTVVFAIYLADAVGYTGSIGVQLFKDLALHDTTRLVFFRDFTWCVCLTGTLCLMSAALYFGRQSHSAVPESTAP